MNQFPWHIGKQHKEWHNRWAKHYPDSTKMDEPIKIIYVSMLSEKKARCDYGKMVLRELIKWKEKQAWMSS